MRLMRQKFRMTKSRKQLSPAFGRPLAFRLTAQPSELPMERVDSSEISKERLDAFQREIDGKLEKSLTFTTVNRASW